MSNGTTNGAAPPVASPVQQQPPIPNDTVLSLTLTVAQINQLLFIVGKQPLEQVIDLFMTIKAQGDMTIARLRAEAASREGVHGEAK